MIKKILVNNEEEQIGGCQYHDSLFKYRREIREEDFYEER
jgi:hypothetical protein